MKKYFITLSVIIICTAPSFSENEDKNIYSGYNSDIQKPADAKTNNVYNSYAGNISEKKYAKFRINGYWQYCNK